MKIKTNSYHYLTLLLLCLLSFSAGAQLSSHEGNLPKFYKQRIHFGFHLGVNTCDFRIHNVKTTQFTNDTIYWLNGGKNYAFPGTYDSLTLLPLKTIYHEPEVGFNLGIVADLRIHDYVRLRFLPTLSFGTRKIVYTYEEKYGTVDTVFTRERKVESAFIMFPLLLKLQSKRLGNFSAYVLGGASYSLDMQSDKKVDPASQIVRVKKNDLYAEAGGGVDFYLQYFKFGFEIKVLNGLRDVLYHDGSKFAAPIKRLNSRMVMFTLTFEG